MGSSCWASSDNFAVTSHYKIRVLYRLPVCVGYSIQDYHLSFGSSLRITCCGTMCSVVSLFHTVYARPGRSRLERGPHYTLKKKTLKP